MGIVYVPLKEVIGAAPVLLGTFPWFSGKWSIWLWSRYVSILRGNWVAARRKAIRAHHHETITQYSTIYAIRTPDTGIDKNKVKSTRTPVLLQGRLERTETNLMHF